MRACWRWGSTGPSRRPWKPRSSCVRQCHECCTRAYLVRQSSRSGTAGSSKEVRMFCQHLDKLNKGIVHVNEQSQMAVTDWTNQDGTTLDLIDGPAFVSVSITNRQLDAFQAALEAILLSRKN